MPALYWATVPMTCWNWQRGHSAAPGDRAVYSNMHSRYHALAVQAADWGSVCQLQQEYGHDLAAMRQAATA